MSQATLSDQPYINSNLFSSHYLDDRLLERDEWECDEEAREAMEELQSLFELEDGLVRGYGEDALVDNWIDEVLEILGFGTQQEVTLPSGGGYVDELLFETSTERREAARIFLDTDDTVDLFERGIGLVEAKQWDTDFTSRFSEQRPYRNASHQIKHYLENTPENIQWGVLTNGRKWRLYGTKDYETQTYYEVDLPQLLRSNELERFKYFYVFFRPAAFQETAGSTFLDEIWSESETAAQELGEDLQDNVFTALRVLGRGFIETNDLEIDPEDEEELAELKEQSLVLLYRLMFVLYAEARGLIHPNDQASQAEYDSNFSLDSLRLDIHETIGEVDAGFDEFSAFSTGMWARLEDLFRLIDQGEEALGIPPYNGGLFDHEEHEFLTVNEVSNRYLAEVIYRLSTTKDDNGRYVLADYADLDTRHLGSVYEGLLEHQFRIAPEAYAAVAGNDSQIWKPSADVSESDVIEQVPEGGLYVVNDQGERKATGAYYTPDYVVTYIVEETIGPLVDEIREDLVDQGFSPGTQEYLGPFLKRVTDLKILDPAMGSGHFLTRATGFLTERVIEEVREVEVEMGVAFDEQHVRREIAKECIYGVDINGMAVELAKLSMWLETLAADRPLAFLDHHFKKGNSLVGSDITEVLSEDNEQSDGQITLTQAFARVRKETLEHVMELMEGLLAIENETLEDINSMKEIYEDIQSDPLYQRLIELVNVHTAERFGVDVPEDAYEQMAGAVEDAEEWEMIQSEDWFCSAQATASEEEFFHWELEFPAVFFDLNGDKAIDEGFDAVLGNPPWVRSINLKRANESSWRFYRENFRSAAKGEFDIYLCFIEAGLSLTASSGKFGFIVPNKWITSQVGGNLRELLLDGNYVSSIVDFGSKQLFKGITTYSSLLFLTKKESNEIHVRNILEQVDDEYPSLDNEQLWMSGTVSTDDLSTEPWTFNIGPLGEIFNELSDLPVLGDVANVFMGTGTRADDVFLLEKSNSGLYSPALDETVRIEDELLRPGLKGSDIEKYHFEENHRLLFPYEENNGQYQPIGPKTIKDSFPKCWDYLNKNKAELVGREDGRFKDEEKWYAYGYPRSMEKLGEKKIVLPDVVNEAEMAFDSEGWFILDTAYGIVSGKHDERYLTAILNSDLLTCFLQYSGTDLRGSYFRMKTAYLNPFPIPDLEFDLEGKERKRLREKGEELFAEVVVSGKKDLNDVIFDTKVSHEMLVPIVEERIEFTDKSCSLNLSLLDYIQPYPDGPTLVNVGNYQPPEGVADSKLSATKEDYENIRIGNVTCRLANEGKLLLLATARYKPDDEDAHETDQWGYTETEPLPAMRITDLSETEADLIKAFVPVAVDEAGGFANFRETATKTNSLIDRLEALTLPDPDDVADDLDRYLDAKERAGELEEKIQRTDALIDEIVYELYGLTDEEIEIVENAVSNT